MIDWKDAPLWWEETRRRKGTLSTEYRLGKQSHWGPLIIIRNWYNA